MKHWLEAAKGLAEAMHEVEALGKSKEKLGELGRNLGRPVVGGLAIEISWSYKEGRGIIYTKYFSYRKEIGSATGPNSWRGDHKENPRRRDGRSVRPEPRF